MSVCLHCGSEYRVKPSKRGTTKYCSRLCQNRAVSQTRAGECAVCGKPFIRGSMKRTTCSIECLVLTNVIPEPNSGCWLWEKSISADGYGNTGKLGAPRPHVILYEAKYGPVPPGRELDHLCRTKACANPDHLEPVTHTENMRRHFGALMTCKNGHPRTPATTRVEPYPSRKGTRACLICLAEKKARMGAAA